MGYITEADIDKVYYGEVEISKICMSGSDLWENFVPTLSAEPDALQFGYDDTEGKTVSVTSNTHWDINS